MVTYYSVIISLIIFFLGLDFYWVSSQYDGLRIYEFLFCFIAFIELILSRNIKFNKKKLIFFLFLCILIFFKVFNFTIYNFQDLISLTFIFFIILIIKKSYIEKSENLLFLLVVVACIPCLFLFISIFNWFMQNRWFDWQMNSGSIRIIDSVLVPIFFLAVYLKSKNYKHINKSYFFIIFLYCLILCFDGARSAILSVVVPMIILLFNQQYRKLALQTFLSILSAFFLYKLAYSIHNTLFLEDKSLYLIRGSTSLRAEMWGFVYKHWLESPFMGLGGGYLSFIEYPYGQHMHNFYFRLIFEWGIVGIVFLIWILFYFYQYFKSNANFVLKMGIIAIAVDMAFSGNLIYSASQLACILFIGLALNQSDSFYVDHKSNSSISSYMNLSKIFILFIFIIYIYIVFKYFWADLICWQCTSEFGRNMPNFWQFGASEHLKPNK